VRLTVPISRILFRPLVTEHDHDVPPLVILYGQQGITTRGLALTL
jgi:hypothetical protein